MQFQWRHFPFSRHHRHQSSPCSSVGLSEGRSRIMKSVVRIGKLNPLAVLTTPGVTLTQPISTPPLCSTVQFFNPLKLHHSPLTSQYPQQINLPRKFSSSASAFNSKSNGANDNNDPLIKDTGGIEENGSKTNGDSIDGNGDGGGGKGSGNGNGRPRLNLKWLDLLLDPDPDNVVAVGLTGVLAWASVQVLWQLFVISIAILFAALKYSFVAALLIFILITLL